MCKFKERNNPPTPPPQRSVASASTMTRHVHKENTAFLQVGFPVRQQKKEQEQSQEQEWEHNQEHEQEQKQ